MSDLTRPSLEGVIQEDTFDTDLSRALSDDCGCGGGSLALGLLYDLIDQYDDPEQIRGFIKEWLNERGEWLR